jgi:hypothetical protein
MFIDIVMTHCPITEFDEALAKKLLEGVRVGETYLEFQFKSGARIVIENE